MMTVLVVFGGLSFAALLIFAGSVAIERKAERWERYERFMHPPDNDDGVTLLEDIDENTR